MRLLEIKNSVKSGSICSSNKSYTYPRHQVVDVTRGAAFNGLFYVVSVGPVIFIFGTCRHDWTFLLSAVLRYGSIQHINLEMAKEKK